MNKICLIGNLTADPELRTTQNGISICTLRIAVNRRFANTQGEREADFFTVVAWRGLADNCARYLTKGRKIGVSGSLQSRSYEDKQGVKRTAYEIVADDVEFLSPKGEGGPTGGTPRYQNEGSSFDDVSGFKEMDDSQLPF